MRVLNFSKDVIRRMRFGNSKNMEFKTITDDELEILDKLFDTKIKSDEDYKILGEIFGEDE
jgi:hypothetical protein